MKLPFVYAQTLDGADLAAALAAALRRLPYFAGRLRLEGSAFSVALTGGGAALTLARSRCTLAVLLPEGLPEANATDAASRAFPAVDFAPFYPRGAPRLVTECVNKDVPLVHAQATALAGGGTVLVLAVPHLLGDLATYKALVAAWAEEHRALTLGGKGGGGSPRAVVDAAAGGATRAARAPPAGAAALEPYAAAALPPGWRSERFERRTAGFIPRLVGAVLWQAIANPGGLEMVAYHVPAGRLAELKAEAGAWAATHAAAAGAPACDEWVSSNDALTAAVWRAIARALPPQRAQRARFFLSVNLRRRLAPPLPDGALGNIVWGQELGASAAAAAALDPVSAPLGALAAAVRAAVRGVDAAALGRELRALGDARARARRAAPSVPRGAAALLAPGGAVVFSRWEWSAGYGEAVFGGASDGAAARPPLWHAPAQMRVPNTVFVLPAPPALPGGGAAVYVTLHSRVAAALRASTPSL